jgi:prephenate dehydrogenase
MWREIFQDNRAGLAEALTAFRAALAELERLIDDGDAAAIEGALDRIRRTREQIGAQRG